MQQKYTSSYFLNEDSEGNSTSYGAEGVEEFRRGGIRDQDMALLQKVDFKGAVVVDFGFGRGEAIKYALEHGAKRVIGVDFSRDAFLIAENMLKEYQLNAELFCDDALQFLNELLEKNADIKIDVVIMLDFVEHIPRSELSKLMTLLSKALSAKGIFVVNTPVFKVDNDVIADGLNPLARDTSDERVETQGMHCNRYTKRSLIQFMEKHGFTSISNHYFLSGDPNINLLPLRVLKYRSAIRGGYPLQARSWHDAEPDEYAMTAAEFQKQNQEPLFLIGMRFATRAIRLIMRRAGFYKSDASQIVQAMPEWVTVKAGPLQGYRLRLCVDSTIPWSVEMVNGTYDDFIFRAIHELGYAEGATFWDIGAHIGYHSLAFAQIVGSTGHVVSFEPNPYNIERFVEHITENSELGVRVDLQRIALSDKNGQDYFSFSNNIDRGLSSGSHLTSVLAPEESSCYSGFSKALVDTRTIDELVYIDGTPAPDLIKIDVEGAESLVLAGANRLLMEEKPALLIEVHNILQMFLIMQTLCSLKYRAVLVPDAPYSQSRCFILAVCDKSIARQH
ncbi:MAG: FkbM family methyltransferase [bacterium]